jgi:hypothetical protein
MIEASDLGRPRSTLMDSSLQDKLLIRELLERWVVWRDASDWERFATPPSLKGTGTSPRSRR